MCMEHAIGEIPVAFRGNLLIFCSPKKSTRYYVTFRSTLCGNRWRERIKFELSGWWFLIGYRQRLLQTVV